MTQVSLTLNNLTPLEANAILAMLQPKAATATAEKRETKVAAPKETKKAKPPVDEDEDDIEDLDDEDEDEVEDDEDEEVKPKATKGKTTKEAKVTFEDVSKAFKAFTQSFDDIKKARTARSKVLAKFGVEQPSELEEDQYADVIKALKVKK